MTPDEVKYRRCQVPGCDYKEVRGSREGDFVDGKFVCPAHFQDAAMLDWARRMDEVFIRHLGEND